MKSLERLDNYSVLITRWYGKELLQCDTLLACVKNNDAWHKGCSQNVLLLLLIYTHIITNSFHSNLRQGRCWYDSFQVFFVSF